MRNALLVSVGVAATSGLDNTVQTLILGVVGVVGSVMLFLYLRERERRLEARIVGEIKASEHRIIEALPPKKTPTQRAAKAKP